MIGVAGWMWLLSCRTPQPFYQSMTLSQPEITEGDRAFLVDNLQGAVRRGRVESVWLLEEGVPRAVSMEHLGSLPLAALAMSWGLLDTSEFRGAEWDAVIAVEGLGRLTVSGWWEPDRRLVLAVGESYAAPSFPEPSPAALTARYGIGALEQGDTSWTPAERGVLGHALSLLTDDEHVVLTGMPFVRYHQGPGDHAAHYIHDNGDVRIQLYDVLFGSDLETFRGSVHHPQPPSAMGILHELGHAVAGYPQVAIYRRSAVAFDTYNALADEINALSQILQRASPAEQRRRMEEFNALRLKVEAAYGLTETLTARLQAAIPSPVVVEYLAIRGEGGGPTPYGETSDAESFAESFALFHVDPDALKRIYPQVWQWLSEGRHMAALRTSLQGL